MLDTKLWKTLRAGGLGHRAAAALADKSSPTYVGSDFSSLNRLSMAMDLGIAATEDEKLPYAPNLSVNSVYPLRAGGSLDINLAVPQAEFALLNISLAKVADANGIPVAGVPGIYSYTLDNTAPDDTPVTPDPIGTVTGWTVTNYIKSSGQWHWALAQATAGHYAVAVSAGLYYPGA